MMEYAAYLGIDLGRKQDLIYSPLSISLIIDLLK